MPREAHSPVRAITDARLAPVIGVGRAFAAAADRLPRGRPSEPPPSVPT